MSTLRSRLAEAAPDLHGALERSWRIAQEEWLPTIAPSLDSFNSYPHLRNIENHLDQLILTAESLPSPQALPKLRPVELYLLLAASAILPEDPVRPDGRGRPWSDRRQVINDGMRVVQERDANNTPTVTYTRGLDLSGSMEGAGGIGGMLARSAGYSGGSWSSHRFYHADGNGNITCMINESYTMRIEKRSEAGGPSFRFCVILRCLPSA